MRVSQFKVYSVGIVAANKLLSSKDIEVTPIEDSPMLDGEITDATVAQTASAASEEGSAYHVDVTLTNSIKATWLPIGSSNRLTAPDVRRGEQVILYQFADSDQFWWTTLKDDMRLRKLETVIYGFSATQDEKVGVTPESMYFLEISTHNKIVHFHTSKANGEPYAYDIQINTKEGFIRIQDDTGNFISFDSKERQIEIANNEGSSINMNKKVISLTSVDLIELKSKVITSVAGSLISEQAPTITESADSLNITAHTTHTGNTNHNGNIALAGNLSSSAGSGGSGTAAFAGTVSSDKDITSQGTVHATQVISDSAIIAPNVK